MPNESNKSNKSNKSNESIEPGALIEKYQSVSMEDRYLGGEKPNPKNNVSQREMFENLTAGVVEFFATVSLEKDLTEDAIKLQVQTFLTKGYRRLDSKSIRNCVSVIKLVQNQEKEIRTLFEKGTKTSEILNRIGEIYRPLVDKVVAEKAEKQISKRNAVFDEHKTFIESKLREVPSGEKMTEERLNDLLSNAKTALRDGDFVKAELYLDMHRDQQRGIYSEFIEASNDNNLDMPIYLADARYLTDASAQQMDVPEKDTFENWAVMGLSYFQIADRMVEIDKLSLNLLDGNFSDKYKKLEEFKKNNRQNAQFFLEKMSKKDATSAEQYMNTAVRHWVAPELAKALDISPKESLKRMTKFKDFGNMDEPTFSTVTLTRHQASNSEPAKFTDVVREDLPIYQLTNAQRKEYENIRDGKDPLPEWFTVQSDEAKKMIQHYSRYLAHDELNGNEKGRAIPTQLRKYCAGLRNAKETRGYRTDREGNLQLFFMDYSSGNLGHIIHRAHNDALTREAIEQVKELTGAKDLYVNALVSTNAVRAAAIGSDEPDLDRQVAQGVAASKAVTYGRTVLNSSRAIESNNMEAADKLYETVTELFENLTLISLRFSATINQLCLKLNQVKNEYEGLNGGSTFMNDEDNKNLQMTAKLKQMVSLVRQLHDWIPNDTQDNIELKEKLNMALFTFCQSGKDREGELRDVAFMEALERDITKKSPKLSAIDKQGNGDPVSVSIMQKEVRAGHIGRAAAFQSRGAESVKDSEGITPSFFASMKDFVLRRPAKFNSKLPTEEKEPLSWPKTVLIALTGVGLFYLAYKSYTSYQYHKNVEEVRAEFLKSAELAQSGENITRNDGITEAGASFSNISTASTVAFIISKEAFERHQQNSGVVSPRPADVYVPNGGTGSTADAYIALSKENCKKTACHANLNYENVEEDKNVVVQQYLQKNTFDSNQEPLDVQVEVVATGSSYRL